MKKTLIIIIVMSLCLVGVSLMQVNSLNKAYNFKKNELIKNAEKVINKIENNFEYYFYEDTSLNFSFSDSSEIINKIDSNDLNIEIGNWDSIPGNFEEKIHNAVDFFVGAFKGLTSDFVKINYDTISEVLNSELSKYDIINYEYQFFYNDSLKESNCKEISEGGYIITKTVSSSFFSKNILIKLNLTSIRSHIISEIKWTLFLPISLLIITLISYILIVNTILKQKKIDEIKNDFIDNITHELKTPISTISLAIEALQNFEALDDKDKTERYLNISKNANNRLAMLVDKILNISKFERKDIELKKTSFNIIDVLNEIISSVNIKISQKNGVTKINTSNNTQLLFADKEHITTVFYNLIDNAVKYSGKNLVININISNNENYLIISINDNGIGIPSNHLSKIFDKFHRVPNKNIHNIKGFGLGLSYVKSIIEMHKGVIEVKSKLNTGSEFIIKLPHHE